MSGMFWVLVFGSAGIMALAIILYAVWIVLIEDLNDGKEWHE